MKGIGFVSLKTRNTRLSFYGKHLKSIYSYISKGFLKYFTNKNANPTPIKAPIIVCDTVWHFSTYTLIYIAINVRKTKINIFNLSLICKLISVAIKANV